MDIEPSPVHIVKKVSKISFRSGMNPEGKTAWKIIFHFSFAHID